MNQALNRIIALLNLQWSISSSDRVRCCFSNSRRCCVISNPSCGDRVPCWTKNATTARGVWVTLLPAISHGDVALKKPKVHCRILHGHQLGEGIVIASIYLPHTMQGYNKHSQSCTKSLLDKLTDFLSTMCVYVCVDSREEHRGYNFGLIL